MPGERARERVFGPVPDGGREPAGLADVRWGIGIARKGWATAKDVLNTKPWPWWT